MCDKGKVEQEIKTLFASVDTDKSGYIDSAEVEKLLNEYFKGKPNKPDPAKIKAEVSAFITDLDTDKDNKVSQKEFVDFLSKLLG